MSHEIGGQGIRLGDGPGPNQAPGDDADKMRSCVELELARAKSNNIKVDGQIKKAHETAKIKLHHSEQSKNLDRK